jgi:hypothetical protein
MKRLLLLISMVILSVFLLSMPVSAKSAYYNVIHDSGLPREMLGDGTTNAVTKCRDFVDAYRFAHEQLYLHGYYRGISDDHAPLIYAMNEALATEGYTPDTFWRASDDQNAKELGFETVSALWTGVDQLSKSADNRDKEKAEQLKRDWEAKWR